MTCPDPSMSRPDRWHAFPRVADAGARVLCCARHDGATRHVHVLNTARLTLRPLRVTDASSLHRSWSDALTLQHWHRTPRQSVDETAAVLTAMLAEPASHYWALCMQGSDEAIGHAGLMSAVPGRRAALGYLIERARWGQGLVVEACSAILEHGLRELGLGGVEAWVYEANTRSARVAEKLGLTLRTTFVAFNAERSQAIPTRVYGLTASERGFAAPPATAEVYQVCPVLETTDVARSVEFYCQRLGFTLEWAFGTPESAASVQRKQWQPLGVSIRFTRVAHEPLARPGALAITVSDVDLVYAELLAAGVEVQAPPQDQPWGLRELTLLDCDGNRLRFIGVPRR